MERDYVAELEELGEEAAALVEHARPRISDDQDKLDGRREQLLLLEVELAGDQKKLNSDRKAVEARLKVIRREISRGRAALLREHRAEVREFTEDARTLEKYLKEHEEE